MGLAAGIGSIARSIGHSAGELERFLAQDAQHRLLPGRVAAQRVRRILRPALDGVLQDVYAEERSEAARQVKLL